MMLKLLIDAGEMKPNPGIAQKLGPLGINIGKVIQDVNKATADFKGLKIPVELDINSKTKNFQVKVFSPPVAELIKKELGIEKGSGQHKKLKAGNLAIEQVIKIAKTKLPNMLAKDLKSAVKSIVGSCVSLGVMIENQEAKEIAQALKAGKYDKEIEQEKSEASKEKLEELKIYFASLRKKQEEIIKKEEEAKIAEEAAKAVAQPQQPAATEEKKEETAKSETKKPLPETKKK